MTRTHTTTFAYCEQKVNEYTVWRRLGAAKHLPCSFGSASRQRGMYVCVMLRLHRSGSRSGSTPDVNNLEVAPIARPCSDRAPFRPVRMPRRADGIPAACQAITRREG